MPYYSYLHHSVKLSYFSKTMKKVVQRSNGDARKGSLHIMNNVSQGFPVSQTWTEYHGKFLDPVMTRSNTKDTNLI